MEADDSLIVVIVGDGAGAKNDGFPKPIKEEVLDSDEVEKLIETAETHGEFLDVYVKEELEDIDDEDWENVDDEEYLSEDDVDDGSENETLLTRHKMLRPSQRKSFVKELRDQYSELEDNNNALITTLSEIMRNVKPPPPPQDFFIMNGIMFECVTCGAMSDTQPAAGRHYQEKHGERYLICFACGVDFRSTTNLYKHEKRCLAPDAVVVLKSRARVLGRKGRSRPYLLKNLPEENVKKSCDRRYSCNQCSAAFVSKTYLRSHEMLHRGMRPYICSACPSAYTSLAALSRHRKKHSDEEYVCDHCGRAFKVKAALATHMDTHLPVKKFACDQCEKRYATKAALVRHVRREHLCLPPPCVCKICFKRYPLMSVLKEHTKKAHGLLLMTRRMFFKNLPTLTDTQIEQAKVVLKSEVEPDYSYSLQSLPETVPAPVEKSVEISNQCADEFSDQMSNEIADQSEESSEYRLENLLRVEPTVLEDDSMEQRIVLSEEVLQYMQSIQGGLRDSESYKLVVLKEGEVIDQNYLDGHQRIVDKVQLVLQDGQYVLDSEM